VWLETQREVVNRNLIGVDHSAESRLLILLVTFADNLCQISRFAFRASFDNRVLHHLFGTLSRLKLWRRRLLRSVKCKLIFVIFWPSSNSQSHTKRVKLQHTHSMKLSLELLDCFVHPCEERVIAWLPIHFIDLNNEDFFALHSQHVCTWLAVLQVVEHSLFLSRNLLVVL
jgi:hypothetical protein